jgi:hypothetical protein
MLEKEKNNDSELYEILPGLPGVGPLPEQFTATGTGTHQEGFVVRFFLGSSESWIGNFQRGMGSLNDVFLHPNGRTIIVISSGQAYEINPTDRKLKGHFGACISCAIQDAPSQLLIFADLTHLWAFDDKGKRWESKRVSMDGIRNLKIERDSVLGESMDPASEKWNKFSVSLQTGKMKHPLLNWLRH